MKFSFLKTFFQNLKQNPKKHGFKNYILNIFKKPLRHYKNLSTDETKLVLMYYCADPSFDIKLNLKRPPLIIPIKSKYQSDTNKITKQTYKSISIIFN